MKTLLAIIQTLFILTCTLVVIFCAGFIIEFGVRYQEMNKQLINASKEVKRHRDSLAGQVRIINEQERIIKSICKSKPIMQTNSYKSGKRKQDSLKQLKTK